MAEEKPKILIGRREFSIGLGTVALAAPFIARPAFAQGERIILPTYGGSYQDHLVQAITDPFTKETGIEVVFSGAPDLARLKAQVQSGQPEWDVFEAAGSWFSIGSREGLFEPLDASVIGPKTLQGNGDYTLFYQYIAGITWNGDYHNRDQVPLTWKDFWDTEKFPGRRTLRNRADMTLELALVADGVEPDKLYPLDVERAFKSLEKIKPAISKWAGTASELTALVSTNEIDFGINYTGRVKGAQEAGTPLQIGLEQVVVAQDYIAVVKGTPRKEAAMKFVEFALRADRQAEFCSMDTDIPSNPDAVPMMTEEARKWLPADVNSPAHIHHDDAWWAEQTEELQQRFLEFLMN